MFCVLFSALRAGVPMLPTLRLGVLRHGFGGVGRSPALEKSEVEQDADAQSKGNKMNRPARFRLRPGKSAAEFPVLLSALFLMLCVISRQPSGEVTQTTLAGETGLTRMAGARAAIFPTTPVRSARE